MKLKLASLTGVLLLVLNLSAHAQSKRLVSEGARQGVTWKVYLLNKQLTKTVKLNGETRRLYLANVEVSNSYSGVSRRTDLIQCSTSRPFVAFKDNAIPDSAIVHYINPGGETFGYNADSHWEYWVVCHELWQPQEQDLTSRAKQLGYSMKLKSEQVEVPEDIMPYLK
ncbi:MULTISPECIES: hypothetical protein [Nostocales]|uniref:Uncharacterized protein n=3 Tax=Nostocales TaxID=1161 RepID=A0A0C1NFE8_9CYAN|nr:hypothetical protein [Tolypothrix bouteillei]KAF3884234.1 hypothetical protein DA73_0400001045 [Tolypothrix bouteillei VB521301]